MKRILISLLGLLACGPLLAAESTNAPAAAKVNGNSTIVVDSAPAAVTGAIDKLKAETNYSWTVKTELPGTEFTLDPTQGQAEKGGYMLVTMSFQGNTMQAAFKGDKVVTKTEDTWELFDPKSTEFSMGSFVGRTKSAADEAAELARKSKELKAGDGGMWSGDLTEEGANGLLAFGQSQPKNAKGSVKFWVKDGGLAKYETHVKGTVEFGGNEQDTEVIRTIDIHDQGKTKVAVPDEAKKKLEAK